MRIYTVLERRGKPSTDPDRDVVLVKEGFCWPALLFGPLWALIHRMWVVAAILAAVWFGVTMLPSLVPAGGADLQWLAGFALLLVQGVLGNDARVWAAERAGFAMTAVVAAANLAEAERRLFGAMGPLGFGA